MKIDVFRSLSMEAKAAMLATPREARGNPDRSVNDVGRTCAMYARRSTEERTMTLTLGEEEQEVLSRALAHYLNEAA